MKTLKVPTLLEGEALVSWLELTEEEQVDFKTLKKKLIAKMAPLPFTALEEFHARKLHPGELLPLFTQDLKRLLQSAVPGLDVDVREQMLIHQFLTGLPTDISRQLRATGEAKELTKVVERARLLMTMDNQSSLQSVAACASTVDTGTKEEMSRLQNQVEALTQQVAALTTPKATNLRKRCFNCNGLGHLGADKTLSRLQTKAYWAGMSVDIEKYCRECIVCQRCKLSMPQKAPMSSVPIGKPWEMVAVDVLQVPISYQNNRYLLVVQDY